MRQVYAVAFVLLIAVGIAFSRASAKDDMENATEYIRFRKKHMI